MVSFVSAVWYNPFTWFEKQKEVQMSDLATPTSCSQVNPYYEDCPIGANYTVDFKEVLNNGIYQTNNCPYGDTYNFVTISSCNDFILYDTLHCKSSGITLVDCDKDRAVQGDVNDWYATNSEINLSIDCNDADASVNSFIFGYRDFDNDTFTVGSKQSFCSTSLPRGYTSNYNPEDCDDYYPKIQKLITLPNSTNSFCCQAGISAKELLFYADGSIQTFEYWRCKNCSSPNIVLLGIGKYSKETFCCQPGSTQENVLYTYDGRILGEYGNCSICSSPNVVLLSNNPESNETFCCQPGSTQENVLHTYEGKVQGREGNCTICSSPNVVLRGNKFRDKQGFCCQPGSTQENVIYDGYGAIKGTTGNCSICLPINPSYYDYTDSRGKSHFGCCGDNKKFFYNKNKKQGGACCCNSTDPSKLSSINGLIQKRAGECLSCNSEEVLHDFGDGAILCCNNKIKYPHAVESSSISLTIGNGKSGGMGKICMGCYFYNKDSKRSDYTHLGFCNGEFCSRCEGNNVMNIDSSKITTPDGKCAENIKENCDSLGDGWMCVEHRLESYGDLSAKCEKAEDLDSMTFVFRAYEDYKHVNDGTEFFKTGTKFIAKNIYYTPYTADDVFKKISDRCKKSDKPLEVSLVGPGQAGIQSLGEGEQLDKQVLEEKILPKIISGEYDVSCLSTIIFNGCNVGKGDAGEAFLRTTQTILTNSKTEKVKVYAITGVNSRMGASGDIVSIINDKYVKLGVLPQGGLGLIQTIFYSVNLNDEITSIPTSAYQAKVIEGELGEVKLFIDENPSKELVIGVEDSLFDCSIESIEESQDFIINSWTRETKLGDFRIEIPEGTVLDGEQVKLKINKIKTNCSEFKQRYSSTPYIDSNMIEDFRDSLNKGYIDQDLFNQLNILYTNHWQCVNDSQCFGPCTFGIPDCDYNCIENKCVAVFMNDSLINNSLVQPRVLSEKETIFSFILKFLSGKLSNSDINLRIKDFIFKR